ncbi:4-(cytidine 5'-diphospho)-2-C-methyl-D-erythritol kinase [Alphaproteobacteria bacterium]|nr:4-(cytidine 5'-diphospho)-2-C-methyl-D-erythritol kinase [Alphaproteobacteria bacterium]
MNKYYSIVAPAKLNLNLFVTGKNKEGYHLLKSDVCFLELTDKIYIKRHDNDFFHQKTTKSSLTIDPNDNLILKAIKEFRLFTKWNEKFKIYLDKKIPIGAGLGGGSADAASTLLLLRKLYNNNYKTKKIKLPSLIKIGIKLGSDVPACLKSKDLRLEGYGDKITKTKILNDYYFLLINPNINLSTKDVFKKFSDSKFKETKIQSSSFGNVNIHNSLLSSAIHLAPQIYDLLLYLKKSKSIIAYGMTGSGSTCFGIFKNINEIYIFLESFNKHFNSNYFIWYGKKRDYNMNRIRSSKTLENITEIM